MSKLTAKQQAWIDYYKQGHSATESARLAGYKANSESAFGTIGFENLQKLARYIADREEILASPRIATMEEINEFWTGIVRDEDADIKDRLKASELRARAAGGFTEKVQHSGSIETKQGELASILAQMRSESP